MNKGKTLTFRNFDTRIDDLIKAKAKQMNLSKMQLVRLVIKTGLENEKETESLRKLIAAGKESKILKSLKGEKIINPNSFSFGVVSHDIHNQIKNFANQSNTTLQVFYSLIILSGLNLITKKEYTSF